MISGLSVTRGAVRVVVRDEQLLSLLQDHAAECPMCLDELHGTRGCAFFSGVLEVELLAMSKAEAKRRRDSKRKETRDGEAE
jgi:hypothetical protein